MSPLIKKEINLPKDLNNKTKHPELYPKYYGSYNLIHRIDEKIIAVTVIDILPNYLESAYCYYDPDFSFLDLGVVTAIREIEYMKSFQELIDKNFMYYTMGEMSLSVTKLKYKGDYFPTEIMDHYTGIYVPLTNEIRNLLSDNKCHFLTLFGKNKSLAHLLPIGVEKKLFIYNKNEHKFYYMLENKKNVYFLITGRLYHSFTYPQIFLYSVILFFKGPTLR